MEGKGSFFVLLFIVAFLSLTLAGLAGYVFFFAGPTRTAPDTVQQETTKKKVSESDLEKIPLFDKKYFNLKTADDRKTSVIQVGVELQVFKKVNGVKDVKARVAAYDKEMKELIGTYFQNMSLEDVKHPEAKEKARQVLVKDLNKLLGNKEDIVYRIVFDEWFYQ